MYAQNDWIKGRAHTNSFDIRKPFFLLFFLYRRISNRNNNRSCASAIFISFTFFSNICHQNCSFIFLFPWIFIFIVKIPVPSGRWSRSWHWQKSDIYYTQYLCTAIKKKWKTKNKKTKRGVAHNALFHLWWSWQHFNRPIKCNWKKFTHDYKVDHSWRRWRNLYTPIPHTTKNTHTHAFSTNSHLLW